MVKNWERENVIQSKLVCIDPLSDDNGFRFSRIQSICRRHVNCSNRRQILPFAKLKAFAGDKFNVAHIVQFFFDVVENIVGKEKILLTSFSYNVFNRLLPQGQEKLELCGTDLTVAQKIRFILKNEENIIRKGEKPGYQSFLV